jgi:predicted outer membrane repeat protein
MLGSKSGASLRANISRRRARRISAVILSTALVGSMLWLASPAWGVNLTMTVNDTRDLHDADPGNRICDAEPSVTGEQCTLRAAVEEANGLIGNDTITLPSGTYNLLLGEMELKYGMFINDEPRDNNVIIIGSSSTDRPVIDLNGLSRAFDIAGAQGPAFDNDDRWLTLENIQIQDGVGSADQSGSDQGGGAVVVGDYSHLQLINSVLHNNSALVAGSSDEGYGGAVHMSGYAARLTIRNSTLSNNIARYGGGFSQYASRTVTIENSTFSGNHAGNSGGVLFQYTSGPLTITGSTFSNNSAVSQGGAVDLWWTQQANKPQISNTTFSGNSAYDGGAIAYRSQDSNIPLQIQDTTFSGNSAQRWGGAIYSTLASGESFGGLELSRTTFKNNTAEVGGALHSHAKLTVENSTFNGNRATTHGGALYAYSYSTAAVKPMLFSNSTLSGNESDSDDNNTGEGANIYIGSPTDLSVTLKNSIVSDPVDGNDCHTAGTTPLTLTGKNLLETTTGCTMAGDTGAENLIQADPALGVLKHNGGKTHTMAPGEGSPVIDAGSDCLSTDQRGVPRPQGAACDLGAMESPATLTLSVSKTGSGTVASEPAGISCGSDCAEPVPWGDDVTLTATPRPGGSFQGWSGDDGGCDDMSTSCRVTMNMARSVQAAFSTVSRTLTVAKTGPGTVSSSPAGIDCGLGCTSDDAAYDDGTVVRLTAVPDSGGNTFAGWAGTDGGSCSDASTTCDVTMDAAKSVSVAFDPPPPPDPTPTPDASPSDGPTGSQTPSPSPTEGGGSGGGGTSGGGGNDGTTPTPAPSDVPTPEPTPTETAPPGTEPCGEALCVPPDSEPGTEIVVPEGAHVTIPPGVEVTIVCDSCTVEIEQGNSEVTLVGDNISTSVPPGATVVIEGDGASVTNTGGDLTLDGDGAQVSSSGGSLTLTGSSNVVSVSGGSLSLSGDDNEVDVTGDALVEVIGNGNTFRFGSPGPATRQSGFEVHSLSIQGNDNVVEHDGDGKVMLDIVGDRNRAALGSADDRVLITGYDNTVLGGAGDDRIVTRDPAEPKSAPRPGPRHNTLHGQDGNDVLISGVTSDALRGGAGRDRLVGGLGHDNLYGGADNDVLKGGPGKDLLVGGPGKDKQYPGPGRDFLR